MQNTSKTDLPGRTRLSLIVLLFLIIFLAFSAGYVLAQSPVAPYEVFKYQFGPSAEDQTIIIDEIWDLLDDRFVNQPLDDTRLLEGAIGGLLTELEDPHTRYLPPEDEAAARQSMSGEFQGIGVEVESIDGAITVISPIDGSPAKDAGMQPGDILREADGIDLTDMDIGEAAEIIRGPKGTPVSLVIERDGELIELEVIRDVIKLASVRGEIMEDNIAYVRLSQFGDSTDSDLEKLLEELMVNDPVGLILDVRHNPGGGLDTVVDIADQFLPDGAIIMHQQFGDGSELEFEATEDGLAEAVPIAVLIDEGSASASEVLAAAVKDEREAILIGQPSFGKGTIQTWHSLSNDGGLRLTIARWLTPDHEWIHEEGLVPDYSVELDFEEEGEFVDEQLQAAVDLLLGRELVENNEDKPADSN